MRFEFATAQRILFGPGTLDEAGPAAAAFGRRALVATGADPARARPLLDRLAARGIEATTFSISGEPTTDLVAEGALIAAGSAAELVVAIGGGSVLDAAKAIAALATNRGEPLDYLEVVGAGRSLAVPALPVIAIPTTAGTGSEVTRNAVLLSPQHSVKASLRSPTMLPRVAIVDPLLTVSVPRAVTASTGLDALTQLIEPLTSARANPMTDALCLEGIGRVARSLRRACADGSDVAAREDMALASLFGGLALANAGLGVAHGFAGPIGGAFGAPHGAVCAALLPNVMTANRAALAARQPYSPILRRYDEIARRLTGSDAALAADGVGWITELIRDLNVPPLRAFGVTPHHVQDLVDKTAVASSTKANPIALTRDELTAILTAAL